MNQSQEIDKLAEALSLFLGEVQDAHRNQKAHNYNYADLSQILDICRPLLCKYKLSVAQLPVECSGELVKLQTKLMHISGQWLESEIALPVDFGRGMSKAQSIGSVITYARRYALAAMLGIAQTDDDAAPPSQPIKVPEPKKVALVKKETCDQIFDVMKWLNVSEEEQKSWLKKANVKQFDYMSESMAQSLLKMLNKRAEIMVQPDVIPGGEDE